jgi:hypothetical protein
VGYGWIGLDWLAGEGVEEGSVVCVVCMWSLCVCEGYN